MDVMTPQQRRKAMQSNRGRTGPERRFAQEVWRAGFRFLTADGYRARYGRQFLGNPDLIFTRKRVVIFVDGCFWHGCNRCHDFENDCNERWQEKIATNVARDKRIRRKLRRQNWFVIRVWEHQLNTETKFERACERVTELLAER